MTLHRSFKIAHLSDPHLSRQFYREHIKSLKILLRSVLDAGYDHIVISGDLVSTADEDDYYLAREILGKLGLLNSERLTVVPGNHDIFGGPHRAMDLLSFPQHIRSVDYQRHLKLFQGAFAETFDGVRRLSSNGLFPFAKEVGPFTIIGLNSIPPWSLWDNPLGTNGLIDEKQLRELRQIENNDASDSIRIVALHHHFTNLNDTSSDSGLWRRIESNTMRLKGRRRLLRYFESINVRYILHGHIHRNEIYTRNNIYLANGAGAVCDDPVRFLKYNTVTWDGNESKLKTETLPIPYQTSTVTMSLHKHRKPLSIPVLAHQ